MRSSLPLKHVPGIGTVADGEYTFEPQKAEEYVNLDYTHRTDGTVYTEEAWAHKDEAPAEEPEESIVETESPQAATAETNGRTGRDREIQLGICRGGEAPAAVEQPAGKEAYTHCGRYHRDPCGGHCGKLHCGIQEKKKKERIY